MRLAFHAILCVAVSAALLGGCNGADPKGEGTADTDVKPASTTGDPAKTSATQGTVVETMDAGGYTYVKVDAGERQDWYAAPQFSVAVGDSVTVPTNAMPMRNFESPTLGRTFDVVYFASAVRKVGGTDAAAAVRKAHAGTPRPPAVDLGGIAKAEGGMTVAEVFAAGKGAAGREVVLRGKVVKYNAGILGKNWLHVRDGTGGEGTNDITVTSLDTARVGDVVLVRGKLVADRDFGFGYKYDLLIEDASVVVQ